MVLWKNNNILNDDNLGEKVLRIIIIICIRDADFHPQKSVNIEVLLKNWPKQF